VPTLITLHLLKGERVGRCQEMLTKHAVAFAMGTRALLGSDAPTAWPAGDGSQRRLKKQ